MKDFWLIEKIFTAIIESVIRENPTQWLWFQKRWNTPPEMQKKK